MWWDIGEKGKGVWKGKERNMGGDRGDGNEERI